jgi:signal transduction histidine kinase
MTGGASTTPAVVAVVAMGATSAVLTHFTHLTRRATLAVLTSETLVVALVSGATFPGSSIALPYLVVLALLAGLLSRLPGVLAAMAAQVAGLLVVPLVVDAGGATVQQAGDLAPWLLTSAGSGLLGLWARSNGLSDLSDTVDSHYESARQLLTQLRAVTRRLSAGLDSEGMAAALMTTIHERLDDSVAAVFVKTEGSPLLPLAYLGLGAQQLLVPKDILVERCWEQHEPVQGIVPAGELEARHRVVLPLRVGNRMIGVAVSSSTQAATTEMVSELMGEVDAHSVRLDTALVFDEIRTLATADERQRLAREIHDGVAQEIASLGYAVDDMAASVADPAVAGALHRLRTDLSRVVADLRLSIFDLRSDVTATSGLGAALSDYVRAVGARSHLTVHLTLREAPYRLAPAVEAELLRIAQEAITNARKHAHAQNLWVDCWTDPPQATLVIRDDGAGISVQRKDSYGISIMRERAERIHATLEIYSSPAADPRGGTKVEVRVADRSAPAQEGVRAR